MRNLRLPVFNIAFFILLLGPFTLAAQQKYWVRFKDKPTVAFDPYAYFHPMALERRIQAGLPLYDQSDMPVGADYVSQVSSLSDSIGQCSRWLNAMGVWASAAQVEKIKALPFVSSVQPMRQNGLAAATEKKPKPVKDTLHLSTSQEKILAFQTRSLQGEEFRKRGYMGKGIRIAILDVGFKGADQHPAFAHLRQNGQIKMTWDFVKKKEYVYSYGTHGTMVLSCIAGRKDTTWQGLAQEAEFLLARTERNIVEWRQEEDNWIAAAEWADKNGARIISSSLGYTYQRYFPEDMDGHTSPIAQGATLAAKKGMLIINAAGNDGNGKWETLCTPGDADSVLTVGGVSPNTRYHIGFSSYGPSRSGSIKPNVCASGTAIVATATTYNDLDGTSFATPLISGYAACLWGMRNEATNMEIFHQIERSGSLYPYYDYAHGYGIPQASRFFEKPVKPKPTFKVDTGYTYEVNLDSSYFSSADSTRLQNLPALYWHISDAKGFVLKYYVIKPLQRKIELVMHSDLPPIKGFLRIHYDGYTREIPFDRTDDEAK